MLEAIWPKYTALKLIGYCFLIEAEEVEDLDFRSFMKLVTFVLGVKVICLEL